MILMAPGWLLTVLVAALPISEVRGAIPMAVGVLGLPPADAYLLSVIGNLIPVVPMLLFLGPISEFLMRYPLGERFFRWLFARTRRKYIKEHERFGLTALTLFVALPLPMTGAWTGCALAFLLGFRFWPAFAAITAGVLIAGAIVMATVMGAKLLVL